MTYPFPTQTDSVSGAQSVAGRHPWLTGIIIALVVIIAVEVVVGTAIWMNQSAPDPQSSSTSPTTVGPQPAPSKPAPSQTSSVDTPTFPVIPATLPAPAGTLLVSGANDVGQRGLGFASGSDMGLLTAVPQLSGVISVFVDFAGLVYAVTATGELWAWGNNDYGLIGDGTTTNSSVPLRVLIEGHVTAAFSSGVRGWAVTEEGSVWSLGSNYGPVPSRVDALPLMNTISGGRGGTYGLASDGTVWGLDHVEGIFGYDITVPYQILGLSSIVSISAGEASNLALDDQGVVWAWGKNQFGNVGDGTTEPRSSPVMVPGLPAVSSIAIGESTSYALATDGTVWCWGFNLFGMCGTGATPMDIQDEEAMYTSPIQVQGLPVVDRFMAHSQSAIAFSGSEIYAWGSGEFMSYVHAPYSIPGFHAIPSPTRMYGFDGVTALFTNSGSIFSIAG